MFENSGNSADQKTFQKMNSETVACKECMFKASKSKNFMIR